MFTWSEIDLEASKSNQITQSSHIFFDFAPENLVVSRHCQKGLEYTIILLQFYSWLMSHDSSHRLSKKKEFNHQWDNVFQYI